MSARRARPIPCLWDSVRRINTFSGAAGHLDHVYPHHFGAYEGVTQSAVFPAIRWFQRPQVRVYILTRADINTHLRYMMGTIVFFQGYAMLYVPTRSLNESSFSWELQLYGHVPGMRSWVS